MKFTFSTLLFILGIQLVSCQESPSSAASTSENIYSKISPLEFRSLLEEGNVVLIDVRTQAEVSQGMIPGAIHIDIMDPEHFEASVRELKKDVPVMVYCKMGGRSGKASDYMKANGFSRIYDLEGGYLSWEDHEYETVKPKL